MLQDVGARCHGTRTRWTPPARHARRSRGALEERSADRKELVNACRGLRGLLAPEPRNIVLAVNRLDCGSWARSGLPDLGSLMKGKTTRLP